MTDREMLLHVLAGLGITPTDHAPYDDPDGRLYLSAGEGNVEGYQGFYCVFEFDDAGKLKEVGVYE